MLFSASRANNAVGLALDHYASQVGLVPVKVLMAHWAVRDESTQKESFQAS